MKRHIISLIISLLLGLQAHLSAQQKVDFEFNPTQGMVENNERPYRDEMCLNGSWRFMPVFETDMAKFTLPAQFNWETTPLKVPSPWNVNSFSEGDGGDFITYPSYPKSWEEAKMGWMKKSFNLPDNWKDKQVTLHFEAIAGDAKIYVNQQLAAENLDIYFPTSVDITSYLKPGRNEILVGIAKASLTDDQGKYGRRNYVAGSFWGQHIAGIWQDVYLLAKPQVQIHDCFVQPLVNENSLQLELKLKNTRNQPISVNPQVIIRKRITSTSKNIVDAPVEQNIYEETVLKFASNEKIELAPNSEKTVKLSQRINGELQFWTPENPILYGLEVSLENKQQTIDKKVVRFGWRQFSIDGKDLLLNGEKITLKGDSWHFMGIPQMTRRYAWAWFKMLKDANANAVRLHAMPFPSFYLDVADEMGICVLDETGIWSSDGGPKMDSDAYWDYCRKHVKSLVQRDRNHPSVFGWSVCNETLPVAIHVFHAPNEIVQRQIDEINAWVKIVRENDPTRDWISGDGETMRPTDLPTIVGHYGGIGGMNEWSSQDKPWGIGEQGMAYYGTPKQIAEVNGNRAYESQLGRMEGLAIEAYDLITRQRKLNAAYSSVFNIIWYGLQPLELGLNDTSRPATLNDGIYFTSYKEGKPGVQPERIGPYSSTVNPGYDKNLPLYKPWPLFDAIKAANATPAQPYNIEENPKSSPVESNFKIENTMILAADNSQIQHALEELGVVFTSKLKYPSSTLLIIDGKQPLIDSKSKKTVDKILEKGGKIWVIQPHPETLNNINQLLGTSFDLTERKASSFVKVNGNALVNNLQNKNFYFSEIKKEPSMIYGLSRGDNEQARVLFEACTTDWTRWNYQAEPIKTAAAIRSEREAKAQGEALVSLPVKNGEVFISTIDFTALGETGSDLLRTMLANLHITFATNAQANSRAIDATGFITKALYCGTFSTENANLETLTATDFIGENTLQPKQGTITIGKTWKPMSADNNHLFDIKNSTPDEENELAVAYLSLWVYSPRSLVNLLVEPDMPKVDLVCGADDGFVCILNGKTIFTDDQIGGYNPTEYVIEKIPFEKGWNHLFIKSTQAGGEWKFSGQFRCDHPDFLLKMQSKIE